MRTNFVILTALFAYLLSLVSAGSTASVTGHVSVGGLSFDLSTNITTTDDRFHFRRLTYSKIPLINAALFHSVKYNTTANQSSIDAIVGAVYFPPLLLVRYPPTAWIAYFDAVASADLDLSSSIISGDITASGGFISKTFARIEEVNPSGTVVSTILLKNVDWTSGNLKNAGANNELHYQTFMSTGQAYSINITFAVSSVVGVLSSGSPITPRACESFFEMSGYNYADPANNLRLIVYVGYLSADSTTVYSASQSLVSGSGDNQIYIQASGTVVADGKSHSVTVSGFSDTTIQPSELQNSILQGQLSAHATLQSNLRKLTIPFPAGVNSISYDPNIAFGTVVDPSVNPNNSGASLVPSVFALFLAFVAYFRF